MLTRNALATLAALGAVFAAGCASKGYEKSKDLAERIDATVASMDVYAASRTAAFASMAALESEPLAGLPAKFEDFSKSVDHVASADESLRDSLAEMRTSARRRFQAWGEENFAYEDEEMRTQARQRRTQAVESFKKTVKDADAMLVQSAGFVAYLSELRQVLSNDLSTKGVEGVSGFTDKARDSNHELDGMAAPVRSSLVAASVAITSGALAK
jgi:hypothetical protein